MHLVGIDVFTKKKYDDICPASHNMKVPITTREDFTVLNIDDRFLSLMDDQGECRYDLRLPKGELGASIQSKFNNEEHIAVSTI